MLRPGVTQEWVDEGELPRERTKNRRWRRPYDVLAEAMHGEVVVQVHHMRISAGELDCFSAHIRLREPGKSKDKAETAPENIEVLKQVVERGKEERQVQRGSAT
ncbi:hypothetical protein GW17_00030890 [Ensete ventricosum]|nr:hypothetical protein GW17_00030890 [Ensete ventricosum]